MRMGNRTKLSNGTIFSDRAQLPTRLSWSRHYLTMNISETVRHRDIMTSGDLAKYSMKRSTAAAHGLSATAELLVRKKR